MKLELMRKWKKDTYTIGQLYVDGKYFCDTLEDKDRGLKQTMSLTDIRLKKVREQTAIPEGTYEIDMDTPSPKFSDMSRYSYAKICNAKMPRLKNVPGYDGILIHPGNTALETEGCILVGKNKAKGKVLESAATWTRLYELMRGKKEKITITIK